MKYKITFCMYHIITGGIENILLNLIKELSKYNTYDISVVSLKPVTEKKFIDFFKQYHIHLIDVETYHGAPRPKNFFKRKLQYFKRYLNNRTLIKSLSKTDLLIDYFNGFFFKIIKNIPVKKVMFPHCSTETFLLHKEKTIKQMLKTYDKIVCISQDFFNDMITLYPRYADKFVCIYNPVDYTEIQRKSLEPTPEPSDKVYFTCVARLSPEKDHETLLRGFAEFMKNENFPNVYLYILGDGPLLEKWENLSNALQISKNVIFMGNVRNPYKYVKNAMANILSTFAEGLPTVLIEAQSLGVLNIASNVKCGIREILLDNNGGLVFEPQNFMDLAQKMSAVYHNKINKDKMIKKSSDALTRFNPSVIGKDINNLFTTVITK